MHTYMSHFVECRYDSRNRNENMRGPVQRTSDKVTKEHVSTKNFTVRRIQVRTSTISTSPSSFLRFLRSRIARLSMIDMFRMKFPLKNQLDAPVLVQLDAGNDNIARVDTNGYRRAI